MESDSFKSLISTKLVAFNIALSLAFFVVMAWLLQPFVPSFDPFWQLVIGAFTAASITGPFFIALFMFELVLVEQKAASRKKL